MGSAWWIDEIKLAIERKRKAYGKMLQMNVEEEIRVKRRTEYKLLNRKKKKLVKESERKVDGEFSMYKAE